VPDFQQALSNLSNPELLSALDLALLELEKRLFRYAKVGPELLEMADEGLVLAAIALCSDIGPHRSFSSVGSACPRGPKPPALCLKANIAVMVQLHRLPP